MRLKHKNSVYGEGIEDDRTCQKWFAKILAGDFLNDTTWLSESNEIDNDQISFYRGEEKWLE